MKIGLDLDGTILDCKLRQTQVLAALCRACAVSLDTEQYWLLKREGCSNRDALARMGVDELRVDAIVALWEHAIEDMCWLGFDFPLLHAVDTLHRWRESGHSLHLLSARRNHANARQQLRVLGLDCFTSVDFVDPFQAHAKRSALSRLCPDVYIGDTERDAQCARAAAVQPILVSSGLRSEKYLRTTGNWPVMSRLATVKLPSI
ncbi:HAD family hydrolase [Delftia acidovorans]|uniref:HAD family hydrolase n=1 Tax=Delftia acidovorans TaxID=80866 RepID=UPI00192ACCA9|nr:HAD hydrolase-like protein [Delftia acidovorans]